MNTKMKLIKKLRNPANKIVLQAVEELRERGWLADGALKSANLKYVHLQSANLYKVNMEKANLNMADMRWTNLGHANLQGAQMVKTNLYGADMNMTNLKAVNLSSANLQGVRNLRDEQLAQANRLKSATMPDGSRYDGRYNLPGDLEYARKKGTDVNDPEAMAQFYGVSIPVPKIYRETGLSKNTDVQLIRKLRSSDNSLVLRAITELRRRGKHIDGSLEWIRLRFTNLQGADLSAANLRKANLSMADLRGANLVSANLEGASLNKANLSGADLDKVNLQGALLTKTNLQGAHNIVDEQLAQASRLRSATLPDGSLYDGRFNLAGDLGDARILRFNLHDDESLAEFYGVSLEVYLQGQQMTQKTLQDTWTLSSDVCHIDMESLQLEMDKPGNGRGRRNWS